MMPDTAHISSGDHQEQVIQDKYAQCLQTMIEERKEEGEETLNDNGLNSRCPRVWDGIACWREAEVGETVMLPCPHYVAGFDTSANASRQCMEDGGWQLSPDNPNATWTNYSQCSPPGMQVTIVVPFNPLDANVSLDHWLPVVKTIAQVGYSVSLITLIVAFLIMASIKKLRCPRNMLHMHLFASFMMRALMSLLKDTLFIDGVDMSSKVFLKMGDGIVLSPDQTGWECKLVIGLWQFFIMANYSWVLMEGLYLHNLIFLALFSDTSAITLYVVLGWGLPILVIVPWVVLRAVLEDTLCWTTHDKKWLFLIIRIPVIATILINFVLFVNIVRVLLLKLQSSICEETRKYRYRRWAKSTLVLVPLFGVHYTLFLGMSSSMGVNYVVELIWLFCDQFFASFQGSFVAILYCFMNGEVRAEINKIWLHHRKRRGISGGKAQWWLSSGYADGSSSRRTSKAGGGAFVTFPRKSRDMDKCGNKMVSGNWNDGEDRFPQPSSKSGSLSGVPLQPIQAARFQTMDRQMSAPVGSPSGGDSKLSSTMTMKGLGCWNFRRGDTKNGGTEEGYGVKKQLKGGIISAAKRSTAKNWRSRLGMGVGVQRINGLGSSSPYTSAVSYSCHTTHCSIDYGGGGGGGIGGEGVGVGGTKGCIDGVTEGPEEYTQGLWPPLLSDEERQDALKPSPTTDDNGFEKDGESGYAEDGIPLKVKTKDGSQCHEWQGDIETISCIEETHNSAL